MPERRRQCSNYIDILYVICNNDIPTLPSKVPFWLQGLQQTQNQNHCAQRLSSELLMSAHVHMLLFKK